MFVTSLLKYYIYNLDLTNLTNLLKLTNLDKITNFVFLGKFMIPTCNRF